MVTTPPEPRFVVRSVGYTIVSVLLLFGALPLAAYAAGEVARGRQAWPPAPTASPALAMLGLTLVVAGLTAYLSCAFWLMRNGRGPYIEFDPPTRLVATGPYRVVRNPVVLAVLLTMLGEAILWGSVGIALLLAVVVLVVQYQVAAIEEPRLRKRFGDDYVAYCRRVPRWFPRGRPLK